ncbi:transporter substrate-binding domain-containing protein [Undibacterium sp. CCC2.1]|nr:MULTISPECIES: transporter substrate-binding domain-containing protein [unclassified Undibacterium]MEB0140759.1 transporter substrate-binding domain-containing protein [Undibacterium sp. CCC2.1]MEB0173954.1 transporter substrate-binding domain-containing protein [Undibacterium sp. CCC1.1]MEB0177742.1 transporter substrate-binding domain-containing protein [Undibacterium sp. CCC3.4]
MAILLRCCLGFMFAIWQTSSVADALESGTPLNVFGRSQIEHVDFHLSGKNWTWLGQKRQLTIGTALPDSAPFEVATGDTNYEGITADYIDLLGKLMGVQVRVLRFNSRSAALHALLDGRIDLLGSANQGNTKHPELMLSAPYVKQDVVLLRSLEQTDTKTMPQRIALSAYLPLDDYLPIWYPHSVAHTVANNRRAMAELAYGAADAYLADDISSDYLMQKNFDQVRVVARLPNPLVGLSFAMRKTDVDLLESINQILAALTPYQNSDLLKQWGVRTHTQSGASLDLNPREQRWLEKNRSLRLYVNSLSAPVAFFDDDKQFQGITADILSLISERTGLHFEIKNIAAAEEIVDQVEAEAGAAICMLNVSEERRRKIDFTHPFLSDMFVLVVRKSEHKVRGLTDLTGRSLAINHGNPLFPLLRKDYPHIRLVLVDNATQGLLRLKEGKVDSVVYPQIGIDYLIRHFFKDELQVVAAVDDMPVHMGFGVHRDSGELLTILNKAILSIPPDELLTITRRWRQEPHSTLSTWINYRTHIYQIVSGALLILLAFLGWILYLRRQIARRKSAEIKLNDQLAFMRSLIDGTPHPIYATDVNGNLSLCNAAYRRFFLDSAGNEQAHQVLPEFAQHCRLSLQTGQAALQDLFIDLHGKSYCVYHWVVPYHDSFGELVGTIAGWVDMTEREHLLQELTASKCRADEASQAKSIFLATMSHEIRTPMNAIIGMLELTLRYADQGRWDRSQVELAHHSAQALLGLIGDILDIAKIESGKLDLQPRRTKLRELLESVVAVLEGSAKEKSLTLTLSIAALGNEEVLIDPQRLMQIAFNLIGNAIKFTEHGTVNVRLDCAPLTDNRLALTLSVQDSGIGIGIDDQKKLFHPFSQIKHDSQARGGTGLGLVISRKLCEMMGGELSLSSTPGKGTLVVVNLSVPSLAGLTSQQPPALPAKAVPAMSGKDLKQLTVLVVDDNKSNRIVLEQQLEFLGHQVSVAADGREAMQLWSPGSFDLVITDCNMPHLSGYELAQTIRSIENDLPDLSPTTIWGYTANAQTEEIQRCQNAGMNDCIFKPAGLEELRTKLVAFFNRVSQAVTNKDSASELQGWKALCMGNDALAEKLLKEVIKTNRLDLQQLQAAAALPDFQQVAALVHRIKGCARMVQAQQLVELCEQLEDTVSDAQSATRIADIVTALECAVLALETVLRQDLSTLLKAREAQI